MTKSKVRPPRLYSDEKGRFIRLNGKKIYIKSMISNKQLVKVIVNNFQHKRKRKNKKKRKKGDLSPIEQSTGLLSTATTDPDLAKLMFYLTLNKKDDESRKALKLEEDKNELQKRIKQQENQLIDQNAFIQSLPDKYMDGGVVSYIHPRHKEHFVKKYIGLEQRGEQAERQAEEDRRQREQSEKQAEEAIDRTNQVKQDRDNVLNEVVSVKSLINKNNEEIVKIENKIMELKRQLDLNKDNLRVATNRYTAINRKNKKKPIFQFELDLIDKLIHGNQIAKIEVIKDDDPLKKEKDELIKNYGTTNYNLKKNQLDKLIDDLNQEKSKLIQELARLGNNSQTTPERSPDQPPSPSPIQTQSPTDPVTPLLWPRTKEGQAALDSINKGNFEKLGNLGSSPDLSPTPIVTDSSPPSTPSNVIHIPLDTGDSSKPKYRSPPPPQPNFGSPPTPPTPNFGSPSGLPTSPPPQIGTVSVNQNVINTHTIELGKLLNKITDPSTNIEERDKAIAEARKLREYIALHRTQTTIHKKSEPQQKASGKEDGGLYDDQIESVMDQYKNKGFKGVYAIDEISKIPVSDKMGVVLNLDKSNQPGSHWVALYIDADDDQSVEYYDSYGEDPPESLMRDIKYLVNKIDPSTYLKFKINRIKQQSESSDNCGVFAMKFLMDRFNGKKFKECTGYSDVTNSEKKANKMRKQLEKFGYL